MDSRRILQKDSNITVLLDSDSFDSLLNEDNREATAILLHSNSDIIRFIRTPYATKRKFLDKIVEYELIKEGTEIKSISVKYRDYETKHGFGYKHKDIMDVGQHIYNKEEILVIEYNTVLLAFIQAIFNRMNSFNIFITENKTLIKNRLWFENHFPGRILNIMTVEEASRFIDLFYKYRGTYPLTGRHYLNKGMWYWHSTRLKLPHFNVDNEMISALANRVYFSLMALDEIGIQYYLGTNNDTMDTTIYHFNYLLSLFTGIFDNLALKTNTQLGINESDVRKISFNNDDYLDKIRDKDTDLRDFISEYLNFIRLIHKFRNKVIHREGLETTSFSNQGDIRWNANFIKIDDDVKNRLNELDNKKVHDPFTNWGYFELTPKNTYIEPYHFSKMGISQVIEFCDEYLKLLGYDSSIEAQRGKDTQFSRTMELFEKYHLGY